MRTCLILGFTAMLCLSCGASNAGRDVAEADDAYATQQAVMPSSAKKAAPPEMSKERMADNYGGMAENEEMAELDMMPAMPEAYSDDAASSATQSGSGYAPVTRSEPHTNTSANGTSLQTQEEPLIVYNGYLHLRVKRLLTAQDEISGIVRENGGYVDSMTERAMVVRIPGKNFEAMMDTFSQLGDVLSREISAVEVTEQFTDLSSRLAVAKDTRERLLALLNKIIEPQERLRVLEEIKRLSEQIESITSTLATLQNLLDYFTITIDLTPILQDETTVRHQSPFPWIRELSAHRTTLTGAMGRVQMTLPDDFVLFSEADDYRAQAADTTVLRGGVVANDPAGDNRFWSDSIAYEMKGRGETLVTHGQNGKVTWQIFRDTSLQPRLYLTGVYTVGDEIFVIEVFFPNEAAYEQHQEELLNALATFEVTK